MEVEIDYQPLCLFQQRQNSDCLQVVNYLRNSSIYHRILQQFDVSPYFEWLLFFRIERTRSLVHCCLECKPS